MSQNIERAEALRKVRAFAEQTTDRGRTEAEMNIALNQMEKLMRAFAITMDEIALGEMNCITLKVDTGSAVDQAVNHTARAIANFCDCVYYRIKGHKQVQVDDDGRPLRDRRGRMISRRTNTVYVFFGQEQDAKMAEFLFNMIAGAIELETKVFKTTAAYREYRGPKKSASHSFQHGMANRISVRLDQMKDEMNESIAAERPTGSDIIVLKKRKIEEDFTTTGVKLVTRKTNGPRVRAHSSYHQGGKAGDRINLSRPVGNSSSTLLLK